MDQEKPMIPISPGPETAPRRNIGTELPHNERKTALWLKIRWGQCWKSLSLWLTILLTVVLAWKRTQEIPPKEQIPLQDIPTCTPQREQSILINRRRSKDQYPESIEEAIKENTYGQPDRTSIGGISHATREKGA
jgi:hypothetical protein